MRDDKRAEKSADNAKILSDEIYSLKSGHWSNLNRDYKSFWNHVKKINQLFKDLKPLMREDREKLWEKHQQIIEEVKQAQKNEREKRLAQSHEKRKLVEMTINEARNYAKGAKTQSDIIKAKELLNQALQRMKKGWSGFSATTQAFSLSDGVMTKNDHEACWEKWLETKEIIRYKQKEMFDVNYSHYESEAYTAHGLAKSDPREAKSKVKQVQAGLKTTFMAKHQFNEIRRILDDTWQIATTEQQRSWEIRQRKHEEWRDRMESHIERWQELIEKNESVISNIESQIDHCKDLARDARTSDFESKIRGWIDEKVDKINDIRATNRELEERIRSVQDKLR